MDPAKRTKKRKVDSPKGKAKAYIVEEEAEEFVEESDDEEEEDDNKDSDNVSSVWVMVIKEKKSTVKTSIYSTLEHQDTFHPSEINSSLTDKSPIIPLLLPTIVSSMPLEGATSLLMCRMALQAARLSCKMCYTCLMCDSPSFLSANSWNQDMKPTFRRASASSKEQEERWLVMCLSAKMVYSRQDLLFKGPVLGPVKD